ncbi:MAG: flagellar hook-basal body complex protein FliE [Spirochaetia bacterium]|jgi:flagellar hook-basal body complex protein FliE
MALVDPTQATGDIVKLALTNPLHLAGIGGDQTDGQSSDVEQKFGDLLMSALGGVNDSQLKAMDLSQKMLTDPSSVNVEDVTIALADANLALSMTKAIVDRALAAYREIINIR